MGVLVYSESDDTLVLGQALFSGYNVTLDHDNNRFGLIAAPIIPRPVENDNTFAIVVFVCIMISSLMCACLAIYCSLERRRKRLEDQIENNGEEKLSDSRRMSIASARRSTAIKNRNSIRNSNTG
jgi:hypothetical protein